MNSKVLFVLFLGISIGIIACGDNTEDKVDCTGVTPTYTADISPILASCAIDGCHGNIATQANINLTTYEGAKSGSANSKFLKAIKHQSGAEAMPPAGNDKLSDANIKLIECWINNGKPE
jgi:cytochrome c553